MNSIIHQRYRTAGGVVIRRISQPADAETEIRDLAEQLDCYRGVLLSSSYEYPGRYSRWDIGFINPPLVITAQGRHMRIEALNERGRILLPECLRAIEGLTILAGLTVRDGLIELDIDAPAGVFSEEQRSRQPSVFSVLRALTGHFASDEDDCLGFYGAFGYDLAFQFEPIELRRPRAGDARDLVLYLPDDIVRVDRHSGMARRLQYDFICRPGSDEHDSLRTTGGLQRRGRAEPWQAADGEEPRSDHAPGEYAETVREALEHFRRGDLFEVVPGQVFREPCPDSPARVYERLRESNPAPYGALMNLGNGEYLVAASPEMYVRVQGGTVETCPISGTIARGEDAIGDERQIRSLLNSAKDEAELSMCTDVDRNDKSRVCEPGSVEVLGRRQVEMYSRLIHTVDHVRGRLATGYDAMDAFLAHAWAVTVTGAPKHAAMQFIESREKSPRRWYGGAMGCIGFDGSMNTGLTLRTVQIRDGMAEVRAGATLLSDSDPDAEEAETRLKASALLSAIRGDSGRVQRRQAVPVRPQAGAERLRVLMVDHRDSFVHNLGAYFRAQGVALQTLRPEAARRALVQQPFDLVILSPGPGRPGDFDVAGTVALAIEQKAAVFGVCLGMQGIVEHFGGSLAILDEPMHGRPSLVVHQQTDLFAGLAPTITVGRYHSLYAPAAGVPECLAVTARLDDDADVVMAVEHRSLPVSGVQFHPESIMSLEGGAGHRLVGNVVRRILERNAVMYNDSSMETETAHDEQ